MARPTRAELARQRQRIAEIVRDNPNGLPKRAVAAEYTRRHGEVIAVRTLQRRLEELVIDGQLLLRGEGRRASYLPASTADTESAATVAGGPALSAQGARLRALVRLPTSRRTPVGYVPDWLFSYVPGESWYLPKGIRAHLHDVGATPDEDRPAGTFARDIYGRLLIDLAWASSRLEGNTYTRLDTQNLLEFGQRAEGKDAQEAQMILNHKRAIELLVSDSERIGFNAATLTSLHAALSENLLGNPADEGRLRETAVSIGGSTYVPIAIPQTIRDCFERILETARAIPDPFEQAFFAMVHIPYLQPFIDVNKRTSRLAANISLIESNLCPLSFVDVPEGAYVEGTIAVYEHRRVELLRDVFVFAYERSAAQYRVVRDSLGRPDPIRLRYREQIVDVVADMVRAGAAPATSTLREAAALAGIPESDRAAFVDASLGVLLGLNEGSAGRYGLSPREFARWRGLFGPQP